MDKVKLSFGGIKRSSTIDKKIFSHFIEYIGKCIDGGIFYEGDINSSLIDKIREIRPALLWYPGGCFADVYHWKNGVGPQEKRPVTPDPMWDQEIDNKFGTEEYLRVCKQTGAQPCITVNAGSGTAREAAEWVRFCNKRNDSMPRVKYWSIGNELWGDWEIGNMPAERYSGVLKEFAVRMKDIDPDISIIASGCTHDYDLDWNRVILEKAGKYFDFLSLHHYVPVREALGNRSTVKRGSLECYKGIAASVLYMEELVKEVMEVIEALSLNEKISLAFDEFNVWYPGYGPHKDDFEIDYTIEQAIYLAGMLHMMFRNCHMIKIACYSMLVNVMGLLKVDALNNITESPAFLAYKLYAGHTGEQIVETEYNNYYFDSPAIADIPAIYDVPVFDMTATIDNRTKRLFLHIINRDPDKSYILEIDRKGAVAAGARGKVTRRSIDCSSIKSQNLPGKNNIFLKEKVIDRESLQDLAISPHSVENLEFSIDR